MSSPRGPAERGQEHHIVIMQSMWSLIVPLGATVFFLCCLISDVYEGGLGTSNGRVVSFVNSLNSVASYRRQRRAVGAASPMSQFQKEHMLSQLHLSATDSSVSLLHRLQLFCLMFLSKFGTQSLGSIMIGAMPVILKGWRHMSSWFFACALVQLCPNDYIFKTLQRNPFLLLVVRCSCALYKLRKFNFVAEFYHQHLHTPWRFIGMLAVQIVVIDGNNFCSRVVTWSWLRGSQGTCKADVRRGVRTLVRRVTPIVLASSCVQCCGGISGDDGMFSHPAVTLAMRLFVLAIFCARYDVKHLFHQALFAPDAALAHQLRPRLPRFSPPPLKLE
ncbi:hypothetical protein M885DRAFT_542433 [Pelagophyceae sp. CCMP2097]|nr:hypothetical protein M885DRAFT_542433 [Pelagophyceae sp. CCMP2097]|mmetsp:Transcript_31315/g.105425  ORF Transcript_31315/g.105425 Transcript_31315/m.105425 type:complete len:332 (+) Transcript_31315:71-1066(+)